MIRLSHLSSILLAALLVSAPSHAEVETEDTCPPDDCVPWESPNGGSKTFEFKRPKLDYPDAAQAEYTDKPPEVYEDDHVNDDEMDAVPSDDGCEVSVTIENHLGTGLTDSDGNQLDPD